MPNVIQGSKNNTQLDFKEKDFKYEYPEGMDLKPGSKLHDKIKREVLNRARESASMMSNRFDSWNEVDRILNCYMDLDEDEQEVLDEDGRKPVSIVFPYSYAIMETLLSYLFAVFSSSPVFRYEGSGPEDIGGGMLLEKVIEQQTERNKVALNLHTMCRDCLSYGIGPVAATWKETWGVRPRIQEEKKEGIFGLFTTTEETLVEEEELIFEGCALENIDPYLFLPDPNVGIQDVQKGEFNGWINKTNYMNLLQEEENDDDYFNVKYLERVKNKKTSVHNVEDNSGRNLRMNTKKSWETDITSPVDVINMYIKLIPSKWGLGDNDYPEIWYFELAADEVVLQAKKLGLNHGLFPIAVAAPDFDGYSSGSLGRMEILYGLQGILDWLFNSHIANVRKSVNDMLVVDPYLVNMNDLKDPKPGKLIRMRRPAWGKGVKDAVQQLQVNDITRNNIGDSAFIVQWMQTIVGADSPMMGNLRSGGPDRLSSAEFQGTQAGAVNRLERMAKVIGLQAMQDIGYMFASYVQQFMSKDTYVKTVGSWPEEVEKSFNIEGDRVSVSPYDLLIDYDVKILDGTLPGGNFSQQWIQLFQTIAGSEELTQKFDVGRIFKHIAENMGAKNVGQFERVKIVPDAEVRAGVDSGRFVPTEQGGQ